MVRQGTSAHPGAAELTERARRRWPCRLDPRVRLIYLQAIALRGAVVDTRAALAPGSFRISVASSGVVAAGPRLAQMVVIVVAGPGSALVPVAGGQLDVENVHIVVTIDITGGVVGCAGRTRPGRGEAAASSTAKHYQAGDQHPSQGVAVRQSAPLVTPLRTNSLSE